MNKSILMILNDFDCYYGKDIKVFEKDTDINEIINYCNENNYKCFVRGGKYAKYYVKNISFEEIRLKSIDTTFYEKNKIRNKNKRMYILN